MSSLLRIVMELLNTTIQDRTLYISFLQNTRNGEHNLSYEQFAIKNPKINELVNLLYIFNKQIEYIRIEKLSTFDKEYFISLLEYQYYSKIKQSADAFRIHKRSNKHVCVSCQQKHGIPDEIFDECDKIEAGFISFLRK